MTEWLIFAGIMLMGAMVPGANTAIILRNTLQGSRRSGFITAAGMACALGIHVLLSVVGLSALISETPTLYHAIRWLGSAYLIYMGIVYILTRRAADTEETAPQSRHPFVAGIMVSLFNPKILIMFIAIFSHIVADVESQWMQLLYCITPVIVEFSWLSCVILLLTQPSIQRGLHRIRTQMERVIGGGLILLGVKLGLG